MAGAQEHPLKAGTRVKVVNPASPYCGRTGKVVTLASYAGTMGGPYQGPPESRGWRVAFDWPLGGVTGVAMLREDELEKVASA